MPGFAINATGISRSGFSASGFVVSGDILMTSSGQMPMTPGTYQVQYTVTRNAIFTYGANQTINDSVMFSSVYGTVTWNANDSFNDSSNPCSISEDLGARFSSLVPGGTLVGVELWYEYECLIPSSLDSKSETSAQHTFL